MSHGSTDKCEPNFTPLLDLVLQLVMFFMLCANFVIEQTDVKIKLPKANAAKALPADEGDPIFLNVKMKPDNTGAQVLLSPTQREGDNATLDNAVQVQNYLNRKAKSETARTGKPKPEATIILRIDEMVPFSETYPIMRACRNAGYVKVQLRAEKA